MCEWGHGQYNENMMHYHVWSRTTLPSLTMMISTVSVQSLARDRHTDTDRQERQTTRVSSKLKFANYASKNKSQKTKPRTKLSKKSNKEQTSKQTISYPGRLEVMAVWGRHGAMVFVPVCSVHFATFTLARALATMTTTMTASSATSWSSTSRIFWQHLLWRKEDVDFRKLL